MAFMKFYVGNEANASSHRDGIYIAIDTKKIFYNGDAYGGSEVDLSNYATKEDLNKYLPLTGGTLTGYLKMRELDGSELKYETFSLDLVQGYFDGKEAYMKFNVHPGNYSSNRTMIEIGNLIDSNTAANSSDVLGIYSDFFQARFNPISQSFAVCNRPNTSKDVMWSNITLFPGDDDEAYVRITSYLGDSKDSSNFNQAIYKSTGITFRNKTASDLLHAAGGTISVSDIISKVTVPTKVSELTNDSGFLTKTTADSTYQAKGNYLTSVSWSQVSDKPAFAAVATSGSYNDLTNKPTIPNVSTANHSGTISLIIDSNTLSFRSDGIAFNGASIMTVPVVEVLSTEEINQILNS